MRHRRRGFMLLIVIVLVSLAAVGEMLATRHLVRLRKHVTERKRIVEHRVATTQPTSRPAE